MSNWENPNEWADYPEKKPPKQWNPLDDFVMLPKDDKPDNEE